MKKERIFNCDGSGPRTTLLLWFGNVLNPSSGASAGIHHKEISSSKLPNTIWGTLGCRLTLNSLCNSVVCGVN
jgi:hypothetical protein